MPLTRYEKGLYIEHTAREWFERNQGGEFLQARFRCQGGEIDLIFFIPQTRELVFVEVRGRFESSWGLAYESVGFRKLRRLKRAVRSYFSRSPEIAEREVHSIRLDVLSWDQGHWTHIPNIWMDP